MIYIKENKLLYLLLVLLILATGRTYAAGEERGLLNIYSQDSQGRPRNAIGYRVYKLMDYKPSTKSYSPREKFLAYGGDYRANMDNVRRLEDYIKSTNLVEDYRLKTRDGRASMSGLDEGRYFVMEEESDRTSERSVSFFFTVTKKELGGAGLSAYPKLYDQMDLHMDIPSDDEGKVLGEDREEEPDREISYEGESKEDQGLDQGLDTGQILKDDLEGKAPELFEEDFKARLPRTGEDRQYLSRLLGLLLVVFSRKIGKMKRREY